MPLISIIVSLAPGETAWQQLLPQLLSMDIDKEILLLCTSTQDIASIELATRNNRLIKVLYSGHGRASAMNTGARVSNGDYLWFLHADSILPDHCAAVLLPACNSSKPALYYFDLQFLPDGPRWMPINNIGAYFRSRYLHIPFGDQGFFLSRTAFDTLGPFNDQVTCGEDHLLVWQAHHLAIPVLPIGATLMSSARKYHQHGWLVTTLQHIYLTVRQALPQYLALLKQRLLHPRGF